MNEEQKYALISMMDEAKVREAFELDTKKDLPEGAWEYFWTNIRPYYISEDEIPFFHLIHNLDGFDEYEKQNPRESSGRGPAMLYSQEVLLNMLSNPDAIKLLLDSEKMREKMHQFIHGDNYHFFKNSATSQQSLDLLIEAQVLDLNDSKMQKEFLQITEGAYHEQPGLFACFQAAMRHHAFEYNEEHINILIKKCWDELEVSELQKWHKFIGEPLHWTDLVLSVQSVGYSSYQSLSKELKSCISDAHARNFNIPHENFCWLLNLPANYESSTDDFNKIEGFDNNDAVWVAVKANHDMIEDTANSHSLNFFKDEMPAVIHGMIKSFSPNYYKGEENLFKNINTFIGKIKNNNPQLYETMCSLGKTLRTEHQESNAKFAKVFSAIVLHESLSEQLLQSEGDEPKAEPQSLKKLKI